MSPVRIAELIATALIGAVILFCGYKVKSAFDDAKLYKAKYEQANREALATKGVADALDFALDGRTVQESTVSAARAVAETRFEDLKHAHPDTVGTWADQPIPGELRDDERARRLALDGPAAGQDRGEAPDREAEGRGGDPAP